MLLGIKDMRCKVQGPTTPLSLVRATFQGLLSQVKRSFFFHGSLIPCMNYIFMIMINFIITNCAFSCPSYLNIILLYNHKVTWYARNRCDSETITARTEDITAVGFVYLETFYANELKKSAA